MVDDTSDLDFIRDAARDFLAVRGSDHSVGRLADMDWIGLLVAEEHSGAGWRPVECALIAEELARAHDGSPWLGSVLAAAALAKAPDEVRDRWLPQLLKGTIAGGFALAAPVVRIVSGDIVEVLVVADTDGLRLIDTVDVASRTLDVDSLDTTRTSWCLDVETAPSILVGDADGAAELRAAAQLLVSADAIGAVAQSLERLVAYLRERSAFGAPIASFQAIQHRLVELLVFEVKARAIVAKAARALAAGKGAAPLAATAHAFVTAHATAAIDECMQLSGGIGFTWEYPLHHELRRVAADAWLYGSARSSRAQLAKEWGW